MTTSIAPESGDKLTDPDSLDCESANKNFVILIVYNVLIRIGWIFKTESIIMPAVMDAIGGGGGWLRGCLPVLNRLGQSVPPVLVSDRLRKTPQKKWVVISFATMMGLSFLSLAAIWKFLDGESPSWLPYVFLVIYGFFWFCVGVHNLCVSLLYGKLVAVTSRGRLMLIAMTIGAATAIFCAWRFMGPWLDGGSDHFIWLFISTGSAFCISAMLAVCLTEKRDQSEGESRSAAQLFNSAYSILKQDANFRLFAIAAACFGMSLSLFPHYQAYARQNLDIGLDSFVPWIIAQNLGAACFSIPLGKVADQFGNRLALKWTMAMLMAAPLLTIVSVNFLPHHANAGFHVVFFLLGLTPVTFRTFNNYTLEISDRDRQPIYLSTLGMCMALPVVLVSVAVGILVDVIGFEAMFMIVVAILFVGWILTFRLNEPRTMEQVKPLSGLQTPSLE